MEAGGVSGFWLALGFLTTLPARPVPYMPGGLGRAAAWFPVVGLLIGVLLLLVQTAAALLLGPAVAAVLVVVLWAVLTGGLHLDGLADCCDGLLVSAPRERRLEIMRDPRVGSFAVTGLVLVLLLKAAAVFSLPAGSSRAGLAPGSCVGALVDPVGSTPAPGSGGWPRQQLWDGADARSSWAPPSCCHLYCSALRPGWTGAASWAWRSPVLPAWVCCAWRRRASAA